ncbi:hypothetical protein AMAG_11003 [Allomyces macrogynus ATCC 38327]|uniref:Uncharacterized protein n=1 Tax=Allomyces macrogynus (strain ATCC 38327) TaxID=578462 RepID=A0A0L0SSP5_ALLM3|nr:hypothetical protein AMAG_11003 [Allomyces macrogynus ATCC 38327]|eukprot:KNE65364.1 hypothetical protein AMAG_11003 [Allomyces macrogynus ATCC 38327]
MLAIAAMSSNPTAFPPHAAGANAAAAAGQPWPTSTTTMMPPPAAATWTTTATAAPSPATTSSHKRARSFENDDPAISTMSLPTKKFASEEAVAAHLARLRLSGTSAPPPTSRRAGARDHDSILADPAAVLLRHPKRKLSARLFDDDASMDIDTPPERKWDARAPSPRPPRAKARRTGASPARSRAPMSPVPEGGAVTLYRRSRSPVNDNWTDVIHRFLALDDATLVAAWRARAPARLVQAAVSPDAIRAALREAAASARGKRRLLALAGAAGEEEEERDEDALSTGQIEELPDDWDGMLTDDLVVSTARPVIVEADDGDEEDEAPQAPVWNASRSSSSAWNASSPKIVELPPSPDRSPPHTSASWADQDPDAMDVDE